MNQELEIEVEERNSYEIVVQEIVKETFVIEPLVLVEATYGYGHDERPEILELHEKTKYMPNTRIATRFRNVLRNDMESYRVIQPLKIGYWQKLDGKKEEVYLDVGDIVKLFYRNPGEEPVEYYVLGKWSGYDWDIACGEPDIFSFDHFLEHFVTFDRLLAVENKETT